MPQYQHLYSSKTSVLHALLVFIRCTRQVNFNFPSTSAWDFRNFSCSKTIRIFSFLSFDARSSWLATISKISVVAFDHLGCGDTIFHMNRHHFGTLNFVVWNEINHIFVKISKICFDIYPLYHRLYAHSFGMACRT